MTHPPNTVFHTAKRAVIKVGSGVLTDADGLNAEIVSSVSRQICALIEKGLEIILVSSGAMAAGIKKVGLTKRPEAVPKRQAVAAVGQAGLILAYENAFGRCRKKVAQVLLTSEDMSHRQRYLNARNTLNTLLAWGIVPIVNENDTVMVEEIKFGDNDHLAAMIALLMNADILVSLTDIDGLYTRDPRTFESARLIPRVDTIGKELEKLAGAIPGPLGAGGMLSKIKAAQKVTAVGIPMVIANGRDPNVLDRLFAGEAVGTYFVPKTKKLASRKRWIGFTLKTTGTIWIDAGAADALINNGKSLLSGGITAVEGNFRPRCARGL